MASRTRVASDTVIILGAAIIGVLAAQLLSPGGLNGGNPSPSQPGSAVVIGEQSDNPNPTLPPIPTLGHIVNPSAGLDATPTPIPIITMGPPTPSPSIEVSAGPTVKPSIKPTAKPTATPTPAVAAFSCVPADLTLVCTDSSSKALAWLWDWGDGQTSTAQNPLPHTYGQQATYRVTLTVRPQGPSSVVFHDYTVTAPAPTPT